MAIVDIVADRGKSLDKWRIGKIKSILSDLRSRGARD
jgi:hypothetical protein